VAAKFLGSVRLVCAALLFGPSACLLPPSQHFHTPLPQHRYFCTRPVLLSVHHGRPTLRLFTCRFTIAALTSLPRASALPPTIHGRNRLCFSRTHTRYNLSNLTLLQAHPTPFSESTTARCYRHAELSHATTPEAEVFALQRILLSLRLLRPVDVFDSTSVFLSLPATTDHPICPSIDEYTFAPFQRRSTGSSAPNPLPQ